MSLLFVADIPAVGDVPRLLELLAYLLLHAYQLWWPFCVLKLLAFLLWDFSCRIDNFSAFGLSGYRISNRRFEKLSDYPIKAYRIEILKKNYRLYPALIFSSYKTFTGSLG